MSRFDPSFPVLKTPDCLELHSGMRRGLVKVLSLFRDASGLGQRGHIPLEWARGHYDTRRLSSPCFRDRATTLDHLRGSSF